MSFIVPFVTLDELMPYFLAKRSIKILPHMISQQGLSTDQTAPGKFLNDLTDESFQIST